MSAKESCKKTILLQEQQIGPRPTNTGQTEFFVLSVKKADRGNEYIFFWLHKYLLQNQLENNPKFKNFFVDYLGQIG